MLDIFLPEDISPVVASSLLVFSVLASAITAGVGAGGGLLLLAVLSLVLPPLAIIPVHGMIQLGSNGGRALMIHRHIHWRTIGFFLPGVILGGAAGALLLVQLPPSLLQATIALFVIFLCWGPALPVTSFGRAGIVIFSTVTSFLTLFVGATGPLVSGYIKTLQPERFVAIATFATAMVLQHLLKLVVFGFAGFDYWPWLWFVMTMIVAGLAGTWLGLKWLSRISDRHFHFVLNIVLTLLSVRLLWQAVTGFSLD